MTKPQILNFIEKVAGKNCKISVSYYYDKDDALVAYAKNKVINLNKYLIKALKEETFRAMLMHEIGHLKMISKKAQSEREYDANMWAISRAKELGYKKIERRLLEAFVEWKEDYQKNSKFRCYYLAAKIAERNGII